MSTLVVSDLHLGIRTGVDVLRRPVALEALTARLRGVERLVLLGDTLELRHGPARDALAAAEPVLRAIGSALGPDGEVVVVPGNHDHALGAGWLEWRGRREAPEPLGLEQRVPAQQASWIAKRVAGWLVPARVAVGYPGVWLRDDVYAVHGHYGDVHGTVPTFERLGAGLMGRVTAQPGGPACVDDYEAQLAPLYAWLHAVAQRHRDEGSSAAGGGGTAVRVWRTLEGGGRRSLRGRALVLGFPLAVFTVNRLGLGPVRSDVGGPVLRRNALEATAEVLRRLRVGAAHVVFGHSHRTGMLPGDDPNEWRTPSGAQLHNSGSWLFETHFMGSSPAASSPYWPGGAIAVEATGPPRLERLLAEVDAQTLSGSG